MRVHYNPPFVPLVVQYNNKGGSGQNNPGISSVCAGPLVQAERMLRWHSNRHHREPEVYSSVTSGLQQLYKKHLLGLEKDFKFGQFYSPLLTDGDFSAKPMVGVTGHFMLEEG